MILIRVKKLSKTMKREKKVKKWLILSFVTVVATLLATAIFPDKSMANEKVCRLTGLFCPQAIPGTSWIAELGPVTSIPLRTYEQVYFGGDIHGYRTNLLVDVDFNSTQNSKIKIAHAMAWRLTNSENEAQFKSCIRKYATTNLFPEVGNSPRLSDNFADNLVALINRTRGKTLRMNYWIPPEIKGGITLGQAVVGEDWMNNGFMIEVNPQGLDMERLHPENFGKWASTILHEMMHNLGYVHPTWRNGPEDVAGSLIYEADWCLGRQNQDKQPGSIDLMLQDPNRPSGSIPYYTD